MSDWPTNGCPDCNGVEVDCARCNGTGYLTMSNEPTYTVALWSPDTRYATSSNAVPLTRWPALYRLANLLGPPTPRDIRLAGALVDLAPSSVTLPDGTRVTVDPA